MLYVCFLLNIGPDTGWFSYVPLAGPEFSPGKRVDVWAQMVTFTEIAALVAAVELIVTIFKQRAPGMSLNRMPLFVWAMLVDVLHDPVRDAVDRHGEHVPGDGPAGRHPLLQPGRRRRRAALAAPVLVLRPPGGLHHLHAGAGHRLVDRRDVHPAAGLRLPGHGASRWSSTAFLGFGLWVHHMFAPACHSSGRASSPPRA